jgi:hypothetical protein
MKQVKDYSDDCYKRSCLQCGHKSVRGVEIDTKKGVATHVIDLRPNYTCISRPKVWPAEATALI